MVAILVVLTIVLLLGVDLVLQGLEARRARTLAAASDAPAFHSTSGEIDVGSVLASAGERKPSEKPATRGRLWDLRIPRGLLLARGHVWALLQASGRVRIGADQLVLGALGGVDAIVPAKEGALVHRGDPFAVLWRNGHPIRLHAPVTGVVTSVNSSLVHHPDRLYRRLYEPDGWLAEIEPEAIESELPLLRVGESAARWIRAEFERLRTLAADGFAHAVPAEARALADGGDLREGFLSEFDSEGWNLFEERFLAEQAPNRTECEGR